VARAKPILFPQSQCQALRQETYACDLKGKKYRCARTAAFVIDGVKLCRIHASSTSLNILLLEQA